MEIKLWLGDLKNKNNWDMMTQYYSEKLGQLWDKRLVKAWSSGKFKSKELFYDDEERVKGDENEDCNHYILLNRIDLISIGGLEDLGFKDKDWLLVDNVLYINNNLEIIEDVFDCTLLKSKTEKFEWCVDLSIH